MGASRGVGLILLMSDRPDAEQLRRMLAVKGRKVAVAASIDEAKVACALDPPEVIVVLGVNDRATLSLAGEARSRWPDVFLVSTALSDEGARRLRKLRPDLLVQGSELAETALAREVELFYLRKTARRFESVVAGTEGEVGIFVHNNPDPDALASALAFQAICAKHGVASSIYYGGGLGRSENKVFAQLLDIRMYPVWNGAEAAELTCRLGKVVLIDVAEAGANNMLPRGLVPDIVLDHHHTSEGAVASDHLDVQKGVGSTSSLMCDYLQALGIETDPRLAAALLYGVRTDTLDFTRNVSMVDLKALAYLFPRADKNLLALFASPPMTKETLDTLGTAIGSRESSGTFCFSFIGRITDRDIAPQAAELLVREEGVGAAVVSALVGSVLHISARSRDPKLLLGETLKEAFDRWGSGGGHRQSAGAHVNLSALDLSEKDSDETLFPKLKEIVKSQFLANLRRL